jgi:hypothetical protein
MEGRPLARQPPPQQPAQPPPKPPPDIGRTDYRLGWAFAVIMTMIVLFIAYQFHGW